jgi:hypothetical protein
MHKETVRPSSRHPIVGGRLFCFASDRLANREDGAAGKPLRFSLTKGLQVEYTKGAKSLRKQFASY